MTTFDVRYFYDGIKMLKHVDKPLYKKVKNIFTLPKENYDNKVVYTDKTNDISYHWTTDLNYSELISQNSQYIRHQIMSVGKRSDGKYCLAISNDIPSSKIYSLYLIGDEEFKETIYINGEIKHLFEFFKIEPSSRFLTSETDEQILSLFMLHKSCYPILRLCLEYNFTELNDETFTYLMLKASN